VILYSSFSWPAALSQDPQPVQQPAFPGRIRADLKKPVLKLETELELQAVMRGLPLFPKRPENAGDPLAASRQPDNDMFRLWEVPGATHVGAYYYTYGAVDDGSDSIVEDMAKSLVQPTGSKGSYSKACVAPINPDFNTFLYASSLRHMENWAAGGMPPPGASRIATTELNGKLAIARDSFGNAMGGVRTPYLDAPVATLNGWGHGEGFCFLNGTAIPFTREEFNIRYKKPEDFLEAWNAATDSAVSNGFVVEEDKARLQGVGEIVNSIPLGERVPRNP
jgi:hypothetical protein